LSRLIYSGDSIVFGWVGSGVYSMIKGDHLPEPSAESWTMKWLDSVLNGRGILSRRALTIIDARGGGLIFVRKLARQRGVHLILLADGDGARWVAASKSRFRIVC
jgi:hypothetical protein